MSVGPYETPRFEDYVFGIRRGFFDSAKEELSGLQRMIEDGGHAWLDGYVEGIMQGSSKAPITELMKTPSRTQTAKKTRVATTAARDRTEKVKGLNARLGLSPIIMSPTSQSRQPFSPLQPRSLNTIALSPLIAASPVKTGKSAVRGKGKVLQFEKAEKPKAQGKGKRGKQKDVVEGEQPLHLVGEHITVHNEAAVFEVQPPLGLNDPDSPPESVVEGPVTELREELGQQKTSHPSGCNSREDGTTLPDLMLPSDEIVGVIVVESEDTPVESVKIQAPAAQPLSLPVTIVNGSTDLSMIAEGEEENSSLAKNIGKGNSQSSLQALDGGVPAEVMELAPTSEPVTKPESDAVSAIFAVGDLISAPSIGVTASGPVNTSATIPVRQVRSSWLSKALGTGTVPISGLPGTTSDREALRKSSAASSQRPNGPVDLAALRKSLAPAGALKRKSDAGMDEDEEEERRPDKMAKVHSVIPSTVNPLSDSQTQSTIVVPMSNRAPASTTSLPHTNPSPKLPEALMTLQHPRSDIHKVTKALDELRERAQAKELAKQRSAPKATSTGSGFLRGLGNLGRSLGLGNSVKTAEEEAVRLEEERRAEIEAQEELARLIGEVSKPVQPVETGSETDAPLSAALLGPAQQDEVEDEVEVDELEEEVEYHASSEPLFMDVQPPQPDRPITPPQIDSEAVTSTTPADVPPRISTTPAGTPRQAWPPVYPAPVLHAQVEKHLHLSPAKVPKPSSEEPEHSVVAMLSPVHRPAAIIEQKPDQVDGRTSVSRSVTDRLSDTEDEAMEEEEENTEVEAKPVSEAVAQVNLQSFPSSGSLVPSHSLAASTSSQATSNGLLNQASVFAGKSLGFKPATGPVKSLQVAAVAAKKEQVANDRKALIKDHAEQRKQLAAKRKADEERKAKIAEFEEKKRLRAEHEKRRRERDERMAVVTKEKLQREEREAQMVKAKAEEDASKKRKLAPTLNKSGSVQPAKRVAVPAALGPGIAKDASRIIKPVDPLSSLITVGPTKMGPTTFRTATTETTSIVTATTQTSTVTLVQPQADRRPLGPPSRPSAMAQHLRQSTAVQQPLHNRASTVLQQSRIVLQSQLDEKALEIQSEDIVLPDIASEYSDSGDSDKEDAFERPAWAESPQLREALEQQSHRNPDELFGSIRPVSMEELFKVRQGKFRARSSSANWSGGDRLTRTEEVDYARRMGFRPTSGVSREV